MSDAVTISLDGRYWRVLAPKWSHAPLSGDGAARHGGRYNPDGMPALYLSADSTTAYAEYVQELGARPGTICAYDVVGGSVVDLTDAAVRKRYRIRAADFLCAWKEIAWVQKRKPPSWRIAERLHATGIAGVLVPSVRLQGRTNLVLWRWNERNAPTVTAVDPRGDLPRDQRSWAGRG